MGAIAAAVIARRERELVAHMRASGAVSPTTARSIADLGVDTRLVWRRLVRRDVIRDAGAGRFYLDELSWQTLRGIRRRLVLVLAGILIVALVWVLLVHR